MIKTRLGAMIGGAFWTPGATILVGIPDTTPLMWSLVDTNLMWGQVDTDLMWQ